MSKDMSDEAKEIEQALHARRPVIAANKLAALARRLLAERNEFKSLADIQAEGRIEDGTRIASLERARLEIVDAAAKIVENRYPEGTTPGDIRRGLARFVKP